jgi:hypothetical protein
MLVRQQVGFVERGVHEVGRSDVADLGGGRFNIGDQPRQVSVACLGEVNLVADPGHVAFDAVLGVGVVGRLEQAGVAAQAMVVKLKYRDFRIVTRRRTLPYLLTSGDDLCLEAGKLLRQLDVESGVRLLGVGTENLVRADDVRATQTLLFPPPN